ncbi:MAG: response regulator [Elusimicrobiota bacterium]
MPKLILIAEDEPDLRTIAEFRLRKAGYDVVAAADGGEALELARQKRPDLAILDIRMPVMDGIELCKRINSDPELCSVPVIMITASKDIADRQIRDSGAQGCLIKPFDFRDLFRMVDRYLKEPQRAGQAA